MAFNLNAWVASVNGKYVEKDDAYPNQCHDLWLDYLYALGGRKGDGHAPTGDTHSVWQGFPTHRPNLAPLFTKHDAAQIRRGDVVFYNRFAGGGTHVVIALADSQNGIYTGIDQNNPVGSRVSIKPALTTKGAVGVLRPKTPFQETLNQPAISEEEEMKNAGFYYIDEKGRTINVICNTTSGFFHEFESPSGDYNTPVAQAFAVPANFAKISISHANKLRADCADTRARVVKE